MNAENSAPGGSATSGPATSGKPRSATIAPGQVQFDTANLKSSYCNVCNGSSTREEVVVNFGINDAWETGGDKLRVRLEHRIVMSPFAAKRLRDMMTRLIDEHESRYGKLDD